MLSCLGLLRFLLLLLPCCAVQRSSWLRMCLSLAALCSGPLLLCAKTLLTRASLLCCSTSLAPFYTDYACQQSALWPARMVKTMKVRFCS